MAAAMFLAAVFAWAGAVKAVSPATTTRSFRGLGVPGAPLLARAVPVAELATAAWLVLAPATGAVVALGFLVGFTAVVGRALAQGRTMGCGCFGAAARDDRLTWAEPLRNLMLAALAAAGLGAGSSAFPDPVAIAAVGAACAAGALVLGLVRLKVRVGAVWATPLPGSFPVR